MSICDRICTLPEDVTPEPTAADQTAFTEVLAAAAEAGVRVTALRDRSVLLLDALFVRFASLDLPTTGSEELLAALTALDFDLTGVQLSALDVQRLAEHGPAGMLLKLQRDIEDLAEHAQDEQHRQTRERLAQFALHPATAGALGPLCRAQALLACMDGKLGFERALELAQAAHALDPRDPRVLLQLAVLYARQDQEQKARALELVEQALHETEERLARGRGVLLRRRGQCWADAGEVFKIAGAGRERVEDLDRRFDEAHARKPIEEEKHARFKRRIEEALEAARRGRD